VEFQECLPKVELRDAYFQNFPTLKALASVKIDAILFFNSFVTFNGYSVSLHQVSHEFFLIKMTWAIS
jgi:hypothetical protein